MPSNKEVRMGLGHHLTKINNDRQVYREVERFINMVNKDIDRSTSVRMCIQFGEGWKKEWAQRGLPRGL